MRARREANAWQEEALFCAAGHLINARRTAHPEKNRDYCSQCGRPAIEKCPQCGKGFPGGWVSSMRVANPPLPSYCAHCGTALPWTEEVLDGAAELYDLIDELRPEERVELKKFLPDLIADTPGTVIAAVKTGKILGRVEPHFREAFKQIAYGLVVQKAQEILKPFGF